MKKSNICLLIILIFSGFVFWKGWTSLRVKPEKFGIVISKTNGINEKPVVNGEFAWNWQFLLPTNAELKLFSIEPVSVTQTITGNLPSGELYTKYLDSSYRFDYRFTIDVSLTLSPEAVIELIKLNQITNEEDLKTYLTNAGKTVAQFTADYYLKKMQENPNFRPESVKREDILRSIQVYKDFPLVEVFMLSVTEAVVPDYEMYNKLKSHFMTSPELSSASIPKLTQETEVKNDVQKN
jgi:hypothetical protein